MSGSNRNAYEGSIPFTRFLSPVGLVPIPGSALV